jgi:hypothetical protein
MANTLTLKKTNKRLHETERSPAQVIDNQNNSIHFDDVLRRMLAFNSTETTQETSKKAAGRNSQIADFRSSFMPVTLFHTENGSTEEWLIVNDDGTVTHEMENSGWVMAREGINNRTKTMKAEEAKARWASYAHDIDVAIAIAKINADKS